MKQWLISLRLPDPGVFPSRAFRRPRGPCLVCAPLRLALCQVLQCRLVPPHTPPRPRREHPGGQPKVGGCTHWVQGLGCTGCRVWGVQGRHAGTSCAHGHALVVGGWCAHTLNADCCWWLMCTHTDCLVVGGWCTYTLTAWWLVVGGWHTAGTTPCWPSIWRRWVG